MFEELLEDIAQKNGLSEVHPSLKLITGLGAIVLCLFSSGFIPPLIIAFVLALAILVLARVGLRIYAELFLVPVWFALMGVAGIILISGGQDVYWQLDLLLGFALSVTRESVNQGIYVFCRVIGGMSALFFIALTTPMTDIFSVLRKVRVPETIIDLMMIIYRTIFILLDQVIQIYHAQIMRLGYSSYRESITSFSQLCGAAFIASWNAGDDLVRAMDARCYAGKFALIKKSRPIEFVPCLVVITFLTFSLMVVMTTGTITLV